MWLTVVEIALGALIAILITMAIEKMRKPDLDLRIAELHDDPNLNNRPASAVRFLAVDLINKPMPWFFHWMSRSPALHCHGYITFHHLDGQNIFGRAMPIRWSGSPEPISQGLKINISGKEVMIIDPAKLSQNSRMTVYPGESERLDVVAKFDNESECYGWNNDSYFCNPVWRNPEWKIPEDNFLVNITVMSSGEKVTRLFRLINDVQRMDTRLSRTLPDDSIFE